jgi:hypothetical protein
LFLEYLRRVALWVKALDWPDAPTPFCDIPKRIDPLVRADPEVVDGLITYFNESHPKINHREHRLCTLFLHWAAVENMEQAKLFTLPAPYEPLIVLYERGGSITTEHRFWYISLAGGLRIKKWPFYESTTPVVELDANVLDAIDAAGLEDLQKKLDSKK